jgi:Sulfotransferase family
VAERMSGGKSFISRFTHPGFAYEDRYPNFLKKSTEFIDKLTVESWDMYWPYQLIEMSRLETAWFKARRKLFNRHENIKYRLISAENFYQKLKIYLETILLDSMSNPENHTLVLNNSFEPFDPIRFLTYFDNAKSIIVDRDPRDIFVFANLPSEGFNDKGELYRRIAGAFDVNVFIKRLKVYRNSTNDEISDRVLRIRYEDLVLDYASTSEVIYRFLNISPSLHVHRLRNFDPKESIKNVGMWRTYKDQKSIRLIEEAFFD